MHSTLRGPGEPSSHADSVLWSFRETVPQGASLVRFSRGRIVLLVVAVLVLLLATLFFWRRSTPPLVTRILPESQGIVYFDLSPLRAATHFNLKPVPHAPDYQRFIDATGIDFERDLDQAAFALDHLPDATGPNGGLAFSEVFAGHFDAKRLANYLFGIANDTETYAGNIIYSIPSDGRVVRVAILPHGMVAVSNTPTAEQIHSMLDRARTAWLPFGAPQPALLTEHYRDLPVLALAWGIGQIGLPFGDHGEFHLFGFTLPIRLDATFVASLRWTGALRLRVEEIAPNQAAASASAKAVSALLNLGRMAENNLPGAITNADAQAFFNSASIVADSDRAILNATLPETMLRSIVHTPDRLAPKNGPGAQH